jgi:peptide/nickel transport system ATP-binding protein
MNDTIIFSEKENNILEVQNLKTYFRIGKKIVRAVDNISFYLKHGEMLGIVGESGSGKTVTARSVLRIIKKPGEIVDGKIIFKGIDLMKISARGMKKYRGKNIAMIFQEPLSALNPSFTIGWQIEESYKLHEKHSSKKERRERALDMLAKVKIPDPQLRIEEYPHQYSGGMRQRAIIAIALACNPSVLFADEPTTALDVTVQADIMDLLMELRHSMDLSVVLISHNMNLVAQRCERIIVMYAGAIVETAISRDILKNAAHPYTIGLLNAIPDINSDERLVPIPGDIADLPDDNKGCMFWNRCSKVMPICREIRPNIKAVGKEHLCACHLY